MLVTSVRLGAAVVMARIEARFTTFDNIILIQGE
jgi:hypothetical protein